MPFAHDHFRFLGILLNLAADDEKLSFYVFMAQRLQNIFKRSYRRGPVIERSTTFLPSPNPSSPESSITRFVMTPFTITRFVMSRFVMSRFVIR